MPPDCVGRFLCTKSSWRGKYRRIMCITPSAVITQHPDNLSITNTYVFTGEPDIDGVTVGPSEPEEQEFTLSARSDKKVCLSLCEKIIPVHLASKLGCSPPAEKMSDAADIS